MGEWVWSGERKGEKGVKGDIDGERVDSGVESDYGIEMVCWVFVGLIVYMNVNVWLENILLFD